MHLPAPPGYEGRSPREWPIPPMDHGAGAKPSAYTPQMGRLILARVAAGETVKQITADPRMPAYCTIYRWTQVHEEFAEAWYALRRRLAREAQRRDLQERIDRATRRAAEEALGVRRPHRGGRRSSYTRAKGKAVCERLSDGASLSEVVREPGMPSFKVVYRWIRTRPEFRRMYVEACQQRLRALAFDRMLAVDRGAEGLVDLPSADRAVRAIEERIGRTLPKKYRAQL